MTVAQAEGVHLSSHTWDHGTFGVPCAGASTAIMIWSGNGSTVVPAWYDPPMFRSTLRKFLGGDFGTSIKCSEYEEKSRRVQKAGAVVKGRALISSEWHNVYDTCGFLPEYSSGIELPVLWTDAGAAVLKGDEISAARHVPKVGSLKERLRAIPQVFARVIADSVGSFVTTARKQKQECGNVRNGSAPPSSRQIFSRPSLLGGLWWWQEEGCAVCLSMATPTELRGEPAAQGLLRLVQYGFVRALENERPLVEAMAPEALKSDYVASYEDTLEVYTCNLYGGSYKQKPGGSKYEVVWWDQNRRKIPFWRYPSEVVEQCRVGANPGFCFKDVMNYDFEGNYSQLPHEIAAENDMVDAKVRDGVLEPLRVPDCHRHLVRFSPVWMI